MAAVYPRREASDDAPPDKSRRIAFLRRVPFARLSGVSDESYSRGGAGPGLAGQDRRGQIGRTS